MEDDVWPATDLAVLGPPAAPVVERGPRPAWHDRLRSAIASYLPLLLMAFLALGTWWLVKNTPGADDTRAALAPRHEPDYTMRQFVVQRFAVSGELRGQLEGEVLRHYPDTDTIEIDKVRARALGPEGRQTHATAERALSNADGSEVQLQGGAHVVREEASGSAAPPIDFRGEFLHVFFDTERVRSHLPVVVTQGATELHADAMDYDHLSGQLQLTGHVRATFPPRAPAARR